jgi:hypothetical protein
MRNRRRQSTSPVERLRTAIDCLPVATREAMLAGVLDNERIIVGAYVDGRSGICPMLAAHRAGGRTDFLSFARSWDRFARSGGKPRTATEREVRILVAQLEASLRDVGAMELDVAIAEHRRLVGRARRRALQAGRKLADAADPRGEIIARRLRSKPRARPARPQLLAR